MGQYLIDNNAISNFFSGQLPEKAMELIAEVLDNVPNISVITEIEALSWVHTDKNKEQIVRNFVHDANIFSLTPTIVAHCVKIRRGRKIKTPDAIIAATAISHNLILLTSDQGFAGIKGLQILDPVKL